MLKPQFHCHDCHRKFALRRGIDEHRRTYHGTLLTRYKCSECPKTFVNKSIWKKHLKEFHDILAECHDAQNHALSIKNTKKCKLFLTFTIISIHLKQIKYLFVFTFLTVVEQLAAKTKNKIVRKMITCDVLIKGKVCGAVAHGNFNMNRHKWTQHQIKPKGKKPSAK